MRGEPGFFDVDERLGRLSDLGDQLEAYGRAVDSRCSVRTWMPRSATDGAKGGRLPFDPVLMFKILVIQSANNLSDERAEFLINDRLSFMRFLELGLYYRVPDARTIWLFRERLTKTGAIRGCSAVSMRCAARGLHRHVGPDHRCQPRRRPQQRNTEERRAIKVAASRALEGAPGGLRQKDRDARGR